MAKRNYRKVREGFFYRTFGNEVVGPMRPWNGSEDYGERLARNRDVFMVPRAPSSYWWTDGSGRCWSSAGSECGAYRYLSEYDFFERLDGKDYPPSRDHSQAWRNGRMAWSDDGPRDRCWEPPAQVAA